LVADAPESEAPVKGSEVFASPAVPTDALRQPKAARRTTCVLGGYVRSSDESSRPVAHAYVGLFHSALEDDGSTTQFGQWGGTPERFPKWRQLMTWTYSDDDGRFSFDELNAGTYVVHVECGPLVTASTAPQTLAPGEVRGGLDIPLPLAGSLEGHILAPPQTDLESWRVALEPADPQQMHAMSWEGRSDNRLIKSVEDDGSFELGPSEAGLHRVLLVYWPGQRSRFGQGIGLPIGEVMIVAGQTVQQTFDVRQGFPGSLNVTLRIPAMEGEDAPLYASKVSYTICATPSFRGSKLQSVYGSGLMGNPALIGPLEPGRWTLSVTSPISQWTFNSRIEQLVEAGQVQEVTLEVPLYTGTLTCLDSATGGPLANAEVMVWCGDSGGGANTDANGKVRLQCPPGNYKVSTFAEVDGKFEDGLTEPFEWQEDGPHPSTVKLLPPSPGPR
jgi:protocatechuate 3,4-dioxygenase beta subunit